MGTTRSFSAMLNDHLPDQLFTAELLKRDYITNTVDKITDWNGGSQIVPFRSAYASSVSFAALTASDDISQSAFVRGTATHKELFGSLIFNHRDLIEHDGKVNEDTFLRILPDEVDVFMDRFKQVVSTALCSGNWLAKGTADCTSGGVLAVDHIDRFTLGQKVAIDDDNSNAANAYVIAISLDDKTVTLSDSRGGSAFDFSAYTLAQNVKLYHPGATTSTDVFTSMRSVFLSAANGGGTAVHGTTKTAAPALQAVNISGATINSTNILEKLFDAWTECRARGVGNANTLLVSYKHLGSIMKLLEIQKGAFRVVEDPKASVYGWTEITIGGIRGNLKIVGILEMDDDVIFGVDWKSMKFATNGMVRKRTAPDGKMYHETRATTGYTYILDVFVVGDMLYYSPSNNFVIYGISY
jgi:hypothetical protein